MAYRILLVEDTADIMDFNCKGLRDAGYTVLAARTLFEARQELAKGEPDVIVLDVMLPDGSGLELCEELSGSATPILLLTCLAESEQVVRGLRAGGDDYITKPYRFEELLARIEAQLRRVERLRGEKIDSGGELLRLDSKLQRAFLGDRDLMLKPKEYLLLLTLVQNRNRFLGPGELYAEVWGAVSNNDLRTVLVHLSALRLKLRRAAQGKREFRIAHSREGYRLLLPEEEDA